MAGINSHADVIRDWHLLLDAVERSPEVLQEVEKERLKLAQWLTEVRALKARQDELKALGQEVTQKLKESVVEGKEASVQLRAILKAKFGSKNERLVHFRVAPKRKRVRKTLVVVKKPADGEGTGTPGTSPSDKPVA